MKDFANLDNQIYQFKDQLIKKVIIPVQNADRVSSIISEEIRRNKADFLSEMKKVTPIDIKTRLEELTAFQTMMDNLNSLEQPTNPETIRSQVITQNYICFVYLKDTLFDVLKRKSEQDSTLKKCTNFLLNNDVRAFRNAIAHGNWKYNKEFSGLEFWAHKGSDTDKPMTKFEVSQNELNFWQALSRCIAYTSYLVLCEE